MMLGLAGLTVTFTSLLALIVRQALGLARTRETPPAPTRTPYVTEEPMDDLELYVNRAAARDMRTVLAAYGVCAAAHRHEMGANG